MPAALQYTASNGLAAAADPGRRTAHPGRHAGTADDVLIIQGGQQGLDLAAKLVINAGDVIITENPTFLGALIAFAPCEPRYAPVRIGRRRDGHRPSRGGPGTLTRTRR